MPERLVAGAQVQNYPVSDSEVAVSLLFVFLSNPHVRINITAAAVSVCLHYDLQHFLNMQSDLYLSQNCQKHKSSSSLYLHLLL